VYCNMFQEIYIKRSATHTRKGLLKIILSGFKKLCSKLYATVKLNSPLNLTENLEENYLISNCSEPGWHSRYSNSLRAGRSGD
jgi:hypothetical protein